MPPLSISTSSRDVFRFIAAVTTSKLQQSATSRLFKFLSMHASKALEAAHGGFERPDGTAFVKPLCSTSTPGAQRKQNRLNVLPENLRNLCG
jgi:hypothetical protein